MQDFFHQQYGEVHHLLPLLRKASGSVSAVQLADAPTAAAPAAAPAAPAAAAPAAVAPAPAAAASAAPGPQKELGEGYWDVDGA